ncbi:family 1 glycosylhydrolase [Corynebacterium heidelbergense]|uniref:Glycoside hydrolase family 1 n=1 Tax=Corynebacterium heidelbergense TaxID=2055947 RepID=A0A364V3D7_9CORY|nr:family 1 glycosylhydrolase [Corynebacterium heidelbergense]RAV31137.1 glycoside hydrolase family 1 [Corynebacterium heidelbergense]
MRIVAPGRAFAQRVNSFLVASAVAVTFTVGGGGVAVAGDATTARGTGQAASAAREDGFHWGVATSAFQVEGSNADSNWSRYAAGDREEPGGLPGTTKHFDGVRNAVDFRHRYKEDIANAASLGINTFRLSVDWARLEPRPGYFDPAEVAYYDDVMAEIRNHGMTPMITMLHYVYPGWVVDGGGISGDLARAEFTRFSEFITKRWGGAGSGTMWVTLNEPFVFFNHDVEIGLAQIGDLPRYLNTMAELHEIGYRAAHAANPGAQVTTNFAFMPTVTPGQYQIFQKRLEPFLDYVGIDYYYNVSLGNLSATYAAFGDFAKVTPEADGIYYALRQYQQLFPGKPLYIVENGVPTDNGAPRADGYAPEDYLQDVVYWLQRAKADGIPVIGYNHWSLVDNYEWGDYSPRFGLWRVDVKEDPSLTRRETPSVPAYRDVVRQGGMPEGYRLHRPAAFCSLAAGVDSCSRPAPSDGPTVELR